MDVTAVDPSRVMLEQHPGQRGVLARAEQLPFGDERFDAAMGVRTVHHWPDLYRGLTELRRVSRRQVVSTWDPEHSEELRLVRRYLPGGCGTTTRPQDATVVTVILVASDGGGGCGFGTG
ncbi:hypothetical protein Pen02_26930 [Plantactinospora endophytica]|uniref:Methyltransferase type 11 domain-containing protein n=1 Tax=Plantactinospora endophytica TaxID=673535 RepID=A0ABQ4DZ63_9ACTN|nr:hypothetical protein Pen02_26930 [Plantactinospora endophytica]